LCNKRGVTLLKLKKMAALKNVKIGDKFEQQATRYGQYINCTVSSIKVTKSGRILLSFTYNYKDTDGTIGETRTDVYSNGPLSPDHDFYDVL